jgi:uncharacterized protein YecE (DUF72 family)
VNRFYVGTAGFSFPDWEGVAYAKGSPAGERLRHYASTGLNAVELNAAFQSQPRAEWQHRTLEQAPPELLFTLRLPITITHAPFDEAAKNRSLLGRGLEATRLFSRSLDPLRSTGRLAAALASFPANVKPGTFAKHYIEALQDNMEGVPLAVEFRAAEWGGDETAEWLASRKLVLVASDAPRHDSLLPMRNRPTGPLAYFRLHGRNTDGFDTGDERGDYFYTPTEIAELSAEIEKASKTAEKIFVFFNNSRRGQAFKNALRMAETLGITVGPGTTPLQQPELFG